MASGFEKIGPFRAEEETISTYQVFFVAKMTSKWRSRLQYF